MTIAPLRYRPWGLLPWLLNHLPPVRWSLLGSIGAEERCLGAWRFLSGANLLERIYLLRIEDPASRFKAETDGRVALRNAGFSAWGGAATDIHLHSLFARTGEIISIGEQFANSGARHVVLDITTLPKRFFFPLVKVLLRSSIVESLLVTYTMPVRYCDDPLAEDFLEWRALPLFSGSGTIDKPEMLIVNVGYLAMGLPDQIEHGSPRMEVKLLFPFPNSPASYQKTWHFVRTIEHNLRGATTEMKHVHAMDVSDAFDHIVSLTNGGARRALFAPYGPKPISLAMCIYALLTDSPAYYTQPRTYNPDYSVGIMETNGVPTIQAYCLRIDSKDCYSLPVSV
jgi:hypothetical protein